ncbi:MAG: glycosyltransferase family 1 protein [Phycisphaerae bacterium]|nr:glycosyltransferase family 1 protein [Phycisphaerae bacterium]
MTHATVAAEEATRRAPQKTPRYDGVVCFALGDWWYHNRGHFDMQLMKRFAQRVPVLYVNAMGMRVPSMRERSVFVTRVRRKLRSLMRGLTRWDERFSVLSPVSFPAYSRPWWRRVNAASVRLQVRQALRRVGLRRPLVWVVSPPAVDIACRLPRAALVYQRTDDFKHFTGVNQDVIAGMDHELVNQADLVIHVNRGLYEESLAHGARALLTSHGVDYDLFTPEPDQRAQPEDIAAVPHPRIGFYGGIDNHTFDSDLLLSVAAALPDMHFVLVGACSLPPGTFAAAPNVHLLGQKPYEQIPAYGRAFDVAIMPWRKNDWIAACNPVKLKEYLALGKPVVSTPYPEGEQYRDCVYFASTADEFADAIRRALCEDDAEKRAARRQRVAGQTWDALALTLLAEIDDIVAEKDLSQ